MAHSESPQNWLEAGYKLFAEDGREGVSVEKLARHVGRNKSGLYHHFGDLELFFHELMRYHSQVIDEFSREISGLTNFDPEYLELLMQYKYSAFVQGQLRKNQEIALFSEAFNRCRKKTETAFIPLWESYINISDNSALALQLWDILRDLFFIRLNARNVSIESTRELVHEFSKIIEMVRQMAHTMDRIPVFRNVRSL